MTGNQDYVWNQGEDLTISLVYKSGPVGAEVAVDLTSYSLRMDIVAPSGTVLTVLNDKTIADTDPFKSGAQADTSYEVVLASTGAITIQLSRALNLVNGVFYKYLNATPSIQNFSYDIFLRDSTSKQKKILKGSISIEKSVTAWL